MSERRDLDGWLISKITRGCSNIKETSDRVAEHDKENESWNNRPEHLNFGIPMQLPGSGCTRTFAEAENGKDQYAFHPYKDNSGDNQNGVKYSTFTRSNGTRRI